MLFKKIHSLLEHGRGQAIIKDKWLGVLFYNHEDIEFFPSIVLHNLNYLFDHASAWDQDWRCWAGVVNDAGPIITPNTDTLSPCMRMAHNKARLTPRAPGVTVCPGLVNLGQSQYWFVLKPDRITVTGILVTWLGLGSRKENLVIACRSEGHSSVIQSLGTFDIVGSIIALSRS